MQPLRWYRRRGNSETISPVRSDRPMQRLELKIPPVAVFLVFSIIMWVAARELPRFSFSLPGSTAIAAVLAIIAAGFGITAVLDFRRRSTTVHPKYPERSSAIVTSGVYRYSRNPMYLSLALLLAAWAAKLGNLVSVACVPAFMAYMTRFQIKPEERVLLSKFGVPFGEYMESVRRWI